MSFLVSLGSNLSSSAAFAAWCCLSTCHLTVPTLYLDSRGVSSMGMRRKARSYQRPGLLARTVFYSFFSSSLSKGCRVVEEPHFSALFGQYLRRLGSNT